jgi:hypothetical protein
MALLCRARSELLREVCREHTACTSSSEVTNSENRIINRKYSSDPSILRSVHHEIPIALKLEEIRGLTIDRLGTDARTGNSHIGIVPSVADDELYRPRCALRQRGKEMDVTADDHIGAFELAAIGGNLLGAVYRIVDCVETGKQRRHSSDLGCSFLSRPRLADNFGIDPPDGAVGKDPTMAGLSATAKLFKLFIE